MEHTIPAIGLGSVGSVGSVVSSVLTRGQRVRAMGRGVPNELVGRAGVVEDVTQFDVVVRFDERTTQGACVSMQHDQVVPFDHPSGSIVDPLCYVQSCEPMPSIIPARIEKPPHRYRVKIVRPSGSNEPDILVLEATVCASDARWLARGARVEISIRARAGPSGAS